MTDSEKLDLLLSAVMGIKSEVAELKADVAELKAEMQALKKRVTSIELHLENVIDENIKTIAEGHLDLNRKLDEALRVENEKELMLVRINYLEAEVKRIKERLSEIA